MSSVLCILNLVHQEGGYLERIKMLKQKQQISPDRNEKTNKQTNKQTRNYYRKKKKNIEVQNTIFKNKILNSSLRNPAYSNTKKKFK